MRDATVRETVAFYVLKRSEIPLSIFGICRAQTNGDCAPFSIGFTTRSAEHPRKVPFRLKVLDLRWELHH